MSDERDEAKRAVDDALCGMFRLGFRFGLDTARTLAKLEGNPQIGPEAMAAIRQHLEEVGEALH